MTMTTAVSTLIQSHQDHPGLAQGIPPDGLLSTAEWDKFNSLKSDKRRRDWLLGRWTAKQLLQQTIQQRTGRKLSSDEIEIGNDVDGVPTVNCQLSTVNWQWSISISHSQGHAFCAVRQGGGAIGADMEQIEPRMTGFAEAYFTDAEQERITHHASRFTYHALVTAVWSAKEAVLKALHLGLSVDTRAVCCLLEVPDVAADGWLPFAVQPDPQRLPHTPALQGWWRVMDGFVLALALEK
jgi:4'-phosphopantetheinyl transferase